MLFDYIFFVRLVILHWKMKMCRQVNGYAVNVDMALRKRLNVYIFNCDIVVSTGLTIQSWTEIMLKFKI